MDQNASETQPRCAAGAIFIGVGINRPQLRAISIATTEMGVRDTLKVLIAALALVGITGMYLNRIRKHGLLGLIGYVALSAGNLSIMCVASAAPPQPPTCCPRSLPPTPVWSTTPSPPHMAPVVPHPTLLEGRRLRVASARGQAPSGGPKKHLADAPHWPVQQARWLTHSMIEPLPDLNASIDPDAPVPDDPSELLPDAPEPLPPPPIEPTPDDPGGDPGGVPEPA